MTQAVDLFGGRPRPAHDAGGGSKWPLLPGVTGMAEFSACDRYRYKLRRLWDPGRPLALFAMMNPSTADALHYDDPTVRKCQDMARGWGYGGVWIANACAYRATDKSRLLAVPDPVGPRNLAAIGEMAATAGIVVIAHGQLPGDLQRHADAMCDVLASMSRLYVLRLSDAGVPMHPLARGKAHIPVTTQPQLWKERRP